jgi:hypothetical protein
MVGTIFMLGGVVLFVLTVVIAIIFGVKDSIAKKEMRDYIDEQY